MQPIVIPEFPRLRGEEAIDALYYFRHGLTEKQAAALMKVAKLLVSSIEKETRGTVR